MERPTSTTCRLVLSLQSQWAHLRTRGAFYPAVDRPHSSPRGSAGSVSDSMFHVKLLPHTCRRRQIRWMLEKAGDVSCETWPRRSSDGQCSYCTTVTLFAESAGRDPRTSRAFQAVSNRERAREHLSAGDDPSHSARSASHGAGRVPRGTPNDLGPKDAKESTAVGTTVDKQHRGKLSSRRARSSRCGCPQN